MRSDRTTVSTNPTSVHMTTGSQTGGAVADLASSNNVYKVFSSTGNIIEVYFDGSTISKVPTIKASIELKTSVNNLPIVIKFYDWILSRYAIVGEEGYFSGSTSNVDYTYIIWVASNCRKYVNSLDTWIIDIKVTHTAAFTMSVDWIEVLATSFNLTTVQTLASFNSELIGVYSNLGVRVWKMSNTTVETEITLGTPIATVAIPGGTSTLSNTYVCPATVLVVTDSIVVRVYKQDGGAWTNLVTDIGEPITFMTEDLNTTILNLATWTVYYAFWYDVGADDVRFRWGTAVYNSRITNFTYGVFAKAKAGLHPSKPLAVILNE